jgi:hypothetical protein
VGDWRPSQENVGEDVFDHVPAFFVIGWLEPFPLTGMDLKQENELFE